jgi:hypothetical protein
MKALNLSLISMLTLTALACSDKDGDDDDSGGGTDGTADSGTDGGDSGTTDSGSDGGTDGADGTDGTDGGGDTGAPTGYTLTVNGATFDPMNDKQVYVALVNSEGRSMAVQGAVVAEGTFTIEFPNILQEGAEYTLSYFVDNNGNSNCDNGETGDPAWETAIPAVTEDTVIEIAPEGEFVDVCDDFSILGGYDLTVNGSGFDDYNEAIMRGTLVDSEGRPTPVATSVVEEGAFFMMIPNSISPEGTYTFMYYADVTGEGLCDAPPADAAWSVEVTGTGSDIELEVTSSESFTDVCDTFNELDVDGAGFDEWEGSMVQANLVNADGMPVARGGAEITDGAWVLIMANALKEGDTYHLDYYIDVDESGTCEAPPTDAAWTYDLGAVTGATAIEVAGDAEQSDVCDSFPSGGGGTDGGGTDGGGP